MIKVINDIQLSKNFKLSEFVCPDGSGEVLLDAELVNKLQKLRDKVGKPIKVHSGYRNPKYNTRIGGAKESQHMQGKAADITVQGYTPEQVAKLAEEVGFDGIGLYKTFCHVDVRGHNARWNG